MAEVIMAIPLVIFLLYALVDQIAALCAPFATVSDGFVNYFPPLLHPAVPEGGIAIQNCNLNHISVGSAMAVCRADGKWSTNLGECRKLDSGKSCQAIKGFDGDITYISPFTDKKAPSGDHISGTVGIYRCKLGYIVEGYDHTLCFDGQWTVPPPKCKSVIPEAESETEPTIVPHQCSPIKIRRGLVKYDKGQNSQVKYDPGTVAEVECLPGFVYRGPKRHRCNENGRWSGRLGFCGHDAPASATGF